MPLLVPRLVIAGVVSVIAAVRTFRDGVSLRHVRLLVTFLTTEVTRLSRFLACYCSHASSPELRSRSEQSEYLRRNESFEQSN